MYPTRIICRPTSGHRAVKQAAPCLNRAASTFFPAPFIGSARHGLSPYASSPYASSPYASSSNGFGDFAPFFRLLDDTTRALDSFPSFAAPTHRHATRSQQQRQVYQPRFDVRGIDGAYELRGELPGVESKDLEVEFSDENTLVIRGRTESERTEGIASQATEEVQEAATTPANAETSDTASIHSNDSTSSYVKPTVEDEATEGREATEGIDTAASPPESTNEPTPHPSQQQQQQQQPEHPTPHYLLNELTTGTFQRTFTFPSRIDQDAVTASLRNGILNVVVPRVAEPKARRVVVQ